MEDEFDERFENDTHRRRHVLKVRLFGPDDPTPEPQAPGTLPGAPLQSVGSADGGAQSEMPIAGSSFSAQMRRDIDKNRR